MKKNLFFLLFFIIFYKKMYNLDKLKYYAGKYNICVKQKIDNNLITIILYNDNIKVICCFSYSYVISDNFNCKKFIDSIRKDFAID